MQESVRSLCLGSKLIQEIVEQRMLKQKMLQNMHHLVQVSTVLKCSRLEYILMPCSLSNCCYILWIAMQRWVRSLCVHSRIWRPGNQMRISRKAWKGHLLLVSSILGHSISHQSSNKNSYWSSIACLHCCRNRPCLLICLYFPVL
jgi:hypothetical protein